MQTLKNAASAFRRLGLIAAAAAFSFAALPVETASANPQVNNNCRADYKRLCGQFPPQSAETRRCMEVKRRSLSGNCVQALANAGMIPKKYQKERRR